MTSKQNAFMGVGLVAVIAALGIAANALERSADVAANQAKEAPMFEVDPFWPKPLPNHWVLGSAVGVGVDSRDHVFIIHRKAPLNERTEIGASTDPPTGECCLPAPYILEFDPEGNFVNGVPDGLWKSYYLDGQLKSKGLKNAGASDSLWFFIGRMVL